MGLALVRERGVTAPVLTCDVCGRRVERIDAANLMWNPDDLTDGTPAPAALIVHKGWCTQAAEALDPDRYLHSAGGELVLYQLVRNLGMQPRDLERQAEVQALLELV